MSEEDITMREELAEMREELKAIRAELLEIHEHMRKLIAAEELRLVYVEIERQRRALRYYKHAPGRP